MSTAFPRGSGAGEPPAAASAAVPSERRGERPADAALGSSRRGFLVGSTMLATTAWWSPGAAVPAAAWRGEPFDDGWFFDDGFGWSDGPATR
jgi:hypothetical protein